MAYPMVDQITRLKLNLLNKRLENIRIKMEGRPESSQSARSYDGQIDELHNALRRKRDLLHQLRDQHLLDHLSRPHTWGGMHRRYQPPDILAAPPLPPAAPPIHIYHPAPVMATLPFLQLAPPPQPPRIIQQTLPQQPATIIEQLPQQPLITQIPPPHPYPAPRAGSIKEDMVELMLMQNAQMHQIIMHNMMLKALPPMALSPPAGGFGYSTTHRSYHGQDGYHGNPVVLRSDRPKGGAVHHHHHYGSAPPAPQLPPIGYPAWPLPPAAVSSLPGGQPWGQPATVHLPPAHHMAGNVTLPPLNMYGS